MFSCVPSGQFKIPSDSFCVDVDVIISKSFCVNFLGESVKDCTPGDLIDRCKNHNRIKIKGLTFARISEGMCVGPSRHHKGSYLI